MSTVDLKDLPVSARRKALAAAGRTRAPRRTLFSKNRARTYAIRVLAIIAELAPEERGRVLRIASEMNKI